MAVRIRLKRVGRRHRACYRICVMDSRESRDGKAIEEVGTYDPMIADKNQRVTMRSERVDYWLGVGALPTEKVKVLIDKFKGKVPEVRIDKPASRVVPEIKIEPRRPRPRPEPVAAPVAEAATTEAPAAETPAAEAEAAVPAEAAAVAEAPAAG